jgi:hypothetical protein
MGLQDNKKKVDRKTPFRLVYGKEAVMPMEFILPSLCIAAIIDLSDSGASRGETITVSTT